MSELNAEQRAAIHHLDSPLLVLAGAGSGKTRVITHKIAHLIKHHQIQPRHITAVTFTNKAAREMKERVRSLLSGNETRGLRISTFHTLGLDILRREYRETGHKPGFTIYDKHDVQSLLRQLLPTTNNIDEKIELAQQAISRWKNNSITPQQALASASSDEEYFASKCYIEYNTALQTYNAVDLDDLLTIPLMLFQTKPEIIYRWQQQIQHLLVDEYQDTNVTQYEMVKLLSERHRNLTAVGDDDQSIYTWRGAKPENLANLAKDFEDLKVIKLEQNYRSMGSILKAANHLIAHNPHVFEKSLWSQLGFGEPIKIIIARDEEDEAEKIVDQISQHKFLHRTDYQAYAILYRGNFQSRVFEKCLRERNMPYQISGGSSFFDNVEVKDILAYLRLIINPDDDTAFVRIINTPRREIGPATLKILRDYATERTTSLLNASIEFGLRSRLSERAAKNLFDFANWINHITLLSEEKSPAGIVEVIVADIGYADHLQSIHKEPRIAERRMENITELVEWIAHLSKDTDTEEERSLTDIVRRINLMDILERQGQDGKQDAVHLLTLHAAKGLEFSHVFLVGMEEELLPHRTSIEENNIEEERRLAYVGITRAQRSLTLSYAERRKRGGEFVATEPSRFFQELPAEDLLWPNRQQTTDPETRIKAGISHLANLRKTLQEK